MFTSITQIIQWIVWLSNEKGWFSIPIFGVGCPVISLGAFWQEQYGRWPFFGVWPILAHHLWSSCCLTLPLTLRCVSCCRCAFVFLHFSLFWCLHCLCVVCQVKLFSNNTPGPKHSLTVPTMCIIRTSWTEDVHNVLSKLFQNLFHNYQYLSSFDE